MSHAPLKITESEAQRELDIAWRQSYSAERNADVVNLLISQNFGMAAMHFLARLCFRGIYVPQMTRRAWARLIVENRRTLFKLIQAGVAKSRPRKSRRRQKLITSVNELAPLPSDNIFEENHGIFEENQSTRASTLG
jgi:hypothetical protein